MHWAGWGWEQYLSAPVSIVEEIKQIINEQQEERERNAG